MIAILSNNARQTWCKHRFQPQKVSLSLPRHTSMFAETEKTCWIQNQNMPKRNKHKSPCFKQNRKIKKWKLWGEVTFWPRDNHTNYDFWLLWFAHAGRRTQHHLARGVKRTLQFYFKMNSGKIYLHGPKCFCSLSCCGNGLCWSAGVDPSRSGSSGRSAASSPGSRAWSPRRSPAPRAEAGT